MNDIVSRTYEVLSELRSRLRQFDEARMPGTPRRWAQLDPSPARIERMNELAREERADRAANLAAGITALGPSPAPIRLEVVDAERVIVSGLIIVEGTVCEWLGLTPADAAAPVERINRLVGLLDRIAAFPDLARWVLAEVRRLNRVAGRAVGDVEEVRRIDGRCPVCASRSLRAYPEREVIACVNPGCQCADDACPCDRGFRHMWAFDQWAELAAAVA